MTPQSRKPAGASGRLSKFDQLSRRDRREDSPSHHLTQVAGNITLLRPQEGLDYQGRAALRIAERAMRRGGRRGLRLLHLAGYLAAQSLANDQAGRGAAK